MRKRDTYPDPHFLRAVPAPGNRFPLIGQTFLFGMRNKAASGILPRPTRFSKGQGGVRAPVEKFLVTLSDEPAPSSATTFQ